ncbi:Prostaglandin reductase 3 [Irineochytrium annulatum]|nr:Prostaglandin reductase 3 [Irineochytrium annulatum]
MQVAPGIEKISFRKWTVVKLSSNFDEATRLDTATVDSLIKKMKPSDIIVHNAYVAINASDINFTAGRYDPKLRPPFDCGFESLGTVVAVGASVNGIKLGDSVACMSYGAFTEYQLLDARVAIKVASKRPEVLALLVSGLTSSLALAHQGAMTKGETVLVTAAAGGAGQIAVQLAKLAGNHVIGTCSSASKVASLKSLGCDRVINYREEKISDVLRKEYRKGVDIVFESVGGETLKECMANLAVKGRLIVIGAISNYANESSGGPINSFKGIWPDNIPTYELLGKSTTVAGFFLNHYTKEFPQHLNAMLKLVQEGKLKVLLDMGDFQGVESIPRAIKHLQTGGNTGKVIVPLGREGARL